MLTVDSMFYAPDKDATAAMAAARFIDALGQLSARERVGLIKQLLDCFCEHCGGDTEGHGCYCENDE